jgi:hypothetical protein
MQTTFAPYRAPDARQNVRRTGGATWFAFSTHRAHYATEQEGSLVWLSVLGADGYYYPVARLQGAAEDARAAIKAVDGFSHAMERPCLSTVGTVARNVADALHGAPAREFRVSWQGAINAHNGRAIAPAGAPQ